jgi:hypothetical protein
VSQDSPEPVQTGSRKRKQSIKPNPDLNQKRQRISPIQLVESTSGEPPTGTGVPEQTDPIAFWAKEGHWPEEQDWPEETSETGLTMEHLLAQKKPSNLSRKRSNSTISATPSDQKPREEKSAQYRDQRYEALLEIQGSYMTESPLGLTDASQALCRSLCEKTQPVPSDSLFRDDIFRATCRMIHNRNEARVIQDISRLIVPSAESLAAFGAKHLDILTESVNEGWNNSKPFTDTRPQPDYAVGFRRDAFTDGQLAKLAPFLGDFIAGDRSLFMATYYMYFPFLTCEVKCGTTGLDTADRQNAHSMTLAVRAIAELFRAVKRGHEVHRQILAFSISHDDRSVRIYGHYPVMCKGQGDIKYYRCLIRLFGFTELDGRDKWAAYRFTKNVYDIWMPVHFKNICSAIDQLPSDLDPDVPSLSSAGLSQELGCLMRPGAEHGQVPSNAGQQGATPDTSITGLRVAKRRKGPS